MKKIEAIIRPFKLDEVKNALAEIGIDGITVGEVKGFDTRHVHTEVYRGTEFPVDFLPKIKIELMLPDHRAEAAVAAIARGTKTGGKGDDKIFVSNIQDALQLDAKNLVEHAA
jgi:nitrogen regulatory protein P-II 1